ncbi:MAG: nucleotidyltransferase family protein [Eubacterium sp.]
MDKHYKLVLDILKSFVSNSESNTFVRDKWAFEEINWDKVYTIGISQKLLPMLYDVLNREGYKDILPEEQKLLWRQMVMVQLSEQERKNAGFLEVYDLLTKEGIKVVLLKGMLFQELYTNPASRISSDEDVWIRHKDFLKVHKLLEQKGLICKKSDIESIDIKNEKDISYISKDRGTHIEVHVNLFEKDEELYEDMNLELSGSFDRTIVRQINGRNINCMAPTDEFIYLFFHMYKHFINQGVGIRQIMDMMLYGMKYSQSIDMDRVRETLDKFAAYSMLQYIIQIADEYLGIDMKSFRKKDCFKTESGVGEHLVSDILAGGIYGQAIEGRLHGASITKHAVFKSRGNRTSATPMMNVIFPPYRYLVNREPMLRKYPWLLPVAWVKRIYIYMKGSIGYTNHIKVSRNEGKQRLELFKELGIVCKDEEIF